MGNNLPIACSLNASELADRRLLLSELTSLVIAREDLPDGFVYRFAEDSVLERLATIIRAERECCPFLTFRLEMEAGAESFALYVTGPVGSKPFLPDLFAVTTH
jgi:hypothetical protein